jgi:hypothetical protein
VELLEGRELPSATGFLLNAFVGQPVQQADMKVQGDFAQVQKDVTTFIGAGPQTRTNLAVNSTKLQVDMLTLQNDFNSLVGATQQGELTVFLLALSGNLDASDGVFLLQTFNTLKTANADIKSLPGQVAAAGAQPVVVTVPGLSPTVGGTLLPVAVPVGVALNVVGAPSLTLTTPPPSSPFVSSLGPLFGG